MRYSIILILIFKATFLVAQTSQDKDSIQPPIYDTTSFNIQSLNSFYFCSKLYAIPRICDTADQSKCCSFSAQIHKFSKGKIDGQLSCYNGTGLHWMNFENEEQAKYNFESVTEQTKKQMKKFNKEEVIFFVCNKKVKAYKLNYTTSEGHEYTEYIFYGTINRHSILGHLNINNKEKTSTQLAPLFQQLVRF